MKYENAKDILPAQLLAEVQKHAGGKLLYIPVESDAKSWGEDSGYRQKLLKRNVMIVNRYKAGVTLSELAEEYFLSYDSIKKIVYGKKEKNLIFEPTVESAVRYANAGLLEEWVTLYNRDNLDKQDHNYDEMLSCGVVKVPLRLIDDVIQEDTISTNLERCDGTEVPLIITYQSGKFKVIGQGELYQRLVNLKRNAHPAIVMVCKTEYAQFERLYGRYFIVVS